MPRRANGEGTVRERPTGGWEGRIPIGKKDGKTVYRTVYARSKTKLVEKMGMLAGTRHTKATTFAEYAETWLEIQRERVALSTYKTWRIMVRRHLIPKLGNKEIGTILPAHIERALVPQYYLDHYTVLTMNDKSKLRYRGTATFSKAKSVAFSIFERAKANGLTKNNPVESVRLERKQREHKPLRSLDDTELRRFFDVVKGHEWEAYFTLALATGARPSELLALSWSDIDFEEGIIRFTASLGRTEEGGALKRKAMKTPESRRAVDVPHESLVALHKQWESAGKPHHGFVFVNNAGNPVELRNFARRVLAPLVEQAELEQCTLYTFRHTSNSMLLAAGVSPVTLAARLGHTSPRLVETTYATVLVRAKQDAVERMSEVFSMIRA
jgi:integrase